MQIIKHENLNVAGLTVVVTRERPGPQDTPDLRISYATIDGGRGSILISAGDAPEFITLLLAIERDPGQLGALINACRL